MQRDDFRGSFSDHGRVLTLDGVEYTRVFSEDEALRHDPDKTSVEQAVIGFFGRFIDIDVQLDGGDFHVDGQSSRAMIVHYPAGSELYVARGAAPYAALYGSDVRFVFEALASIRDAFHGGTAQDRVVLPSRVEAAWWGAANAIEAAACAFQNPGPLDAASYKQAVDFVDNALRDPVLSALRVDPTLQWARRVLVAAVVPA